MKLAVFCVVAVSVASLTTMLIEGCKRETENPPVDTNTETSVDTNQTPLVDTNNPPVVVPPISTNPTPAVVVPPVAPPAPETQPAETESTYVVKAGDTLGKIAKANGVSLKALEAANSDVQPTRLKVGQKLNLPASTGGSTASTEPGSSDMSSGETYTVKSGDTLSKIARNHGTTVKALKAENNLSSTKIKVGEKLKLPASAEAASPSAAPAPAPMPAPATPPPAAPMATPAPAGNGQ